MSPVVEQVRSGAAAVGARPDPGVGAETATAARSSTLSAGEVFVLAVAGLLPVAALPQVSAWFWAPKAAIALVAIGPGLVVLTRAGRAGDRAAWAAAAFLGVAALATVLAASPLLSLLGLYNLGTGLLFVAACVAAWSLGRTLSDRGRRTLETVLLAAVGVNVLVAWVQTATTPAYEMLELFEGRAAALMGNPVHAAALFGAGLALVGVRVGAAREPRVVIGWLAAAAATGGALQLAGGRTGLVLAAGVVVWIAVRAGVRRAGALLAAVVIGALAAGLVAPDGTVSASSRAASDGAGGITGRADRWATALPAIEERPLLGHGPGQFRRATSPHTTAAAARAFGPDTLSEDAHDVVVEYATTTGLLGLAALGAWLWCAGRRARGPLAAFALVGGVSMLVQPQSVALTPVLVLALGAAAPRPAVAPWPGVRTVAGGIAIVLACAGLAAGSLLLRADASVATASDSLVVDDARAADAALPPWSVGPATVARALTYEAITTRAPDAGPRILAAARAAVARDPSDPRRWNELGGYEMRWGSPARAEAAFEAANRVNPWSARALRARVRLADDRGDRAEVRRLCDRLAQVARTPRACR